MPAVNLRTGIGADFGADFGVSAANALATAHVSAANSSASILAMAVIVTAAVVKGPQMAQWQQLGFMAPTYAFLFCSPAK